MKQSGKSHSQMQPEHAVTVKEKGGQTIGERADIK